MELAAALMASALDFDATDLKPMDCCSCGHRCANRFESIIHTEATGHTRFKSSLADTSPGNWKPASPQVGDYKVGDQVTALRHITHQSANVLPGTSGKIRQIVGGDIDIAWANGYSNNGLQPGEDFKLDSSIGAAGQIRVGSLVMVKEEVKNPAYNWGNVSPGDCGTVSAIIGGDDAKVDFAAQSNWTGKMNELRLVQDAGQIQVGSLVMVKEEVKDPIFNWGNVSPGDCGTVSRILGDGRIKVDFAAQSDWTGKLHEIRLVQESEPKDTRPGRNDRRPHPMRCKTCGFLCSNRAESWEHTEETGHTSFAGNAGVRQDGLLGALLGLVGDAVSAADAEEGGTRVLFHQTSPEAADEILRSQTLRPSVSGLAGGGIYFAESQEATFPKANHHGVILQATVSLGRMKVVRGSADSTTYESLKAEGFDSVKIVGRRSGAEYVIYSWNQAVDIQRVIKRH